MTSYEPFAKQWHEIPNAYQAKSLEDSGHTVYVRKGKPHHDPGICSKCRADCAASSNRMAK